MVHAVMARSTNWQDITGNNLWFAEGTAEFIDGADERALVGAQQARMESAMTNLQSSSDNLSANRSRILDADFAVETSALVRHQILQQAATAMVAQANQLPRGVLALLNA